jgi:hypothetical protein
MISCDDERHVIGSDGGDYRPHPNRRKMKAKLLAMTQIFLHAR